MKALRVLVACESSRVVASEFERLGHYALSCDLLPSDVPGNHHQGDVSELLSHGWDVLIAHPPCTYLSSSGMHWTTRGLRDPKLTEDALDFVQLLMEAPIPHIAIENPVGRIGTAIRKANQYVQPYEFGDDASKRTGLWLKGLPKLVGTKRVPGRLVTYKGKTVERWANQTDSGQNRLGPSADRWKARSETFRGIARAMAEQWTVHLLGCPEERYERAAEWVFEVAGTAGEFDARAELNAARKAKEALLPSNGFPLVFDERFALAA